MAHTFSKALISIDFDLRSLSSFWSTSISGAEI